MALRASKLERVIVAEFAKFEGRGLVLRLAPIADASTKAAAQQKPDY